MQLTIIAPDSDAWGDGGLALYREGTLIAENDVALHDIGLADGLPGRARLPLAQLTTLEVEVEQVTYCSTWLGQVGSFPAELAAVQRYDPDRDC